MPRYDLVLFDLDGVLVDSRDNMEAAWAAVCGRFGFDIPFEKYFAEIGLPFAEILRRIGATGDFDRIADAYREGSLARFELIRPYDGTEAMLRSLAERGVGIGVVTSKDADRTGRLVAKFGTPFDTVCPPRPGLAGKPHPDQLLTAAASVGAVPERTVYVGDMAVDQVAARNAGMSYAHATWGYGRAPERSDIIARDPGELTLALLGA